MKNVKEKVDEIFNSIKNASIKEELISIEGGFDKYKIDINKFPKLDLNIDADKLKKLIAKGVFIDDFSSNYKISPNIMSELTTPLEQFLFAMAWKNGDLLKLKHIIKGFSDASNSINETESAFVFYHFGRHLANPDVEPIIDQHILRAFMVFEFKENDINSEEFNKILKFKTIGKKEKELIVRYKKWLKSDELSKVAEIKDYAYHIDRILFALGKSIKLKK
ncbi:MAG: hypothetical protein H8E16_09690 [Flavobacteriales bacterium]|nr:hypothetical protein [Flavobacteriales bacterium]